MGRFCTKCGTPSEEPAQFCDNCGNPLKKSAATPVAQAAPVPQAPAAIGAPSVHRRSNRTLFIGGAIAGVVGIAAIGVGWWLSPESASAASFSRAIDGYYAAHNDARDALLCTDNLPYQKSPIRVDDTSMPTRQYMDLLVRAGVYDPPQTESSGGYFPRAQYIYAITAEGKKWVRNNRLCVGNGVRVREARGFDQVTKLNGETFALAHAQLDIADEADWLSKSKDREELLRTLNKQSLTTSLPVAIVERKWQVSDRSAGSLERELAQSALEELARAPKASGFIDALKNMLSFGGGHPLVGKWQDTTGAYALEFTRDSIVQNGIPVKARFESKGDRVTVIPETAAGGRLVLKLRDSNTAVLDLGLGAVTLTRTN